MLTTRVSHERKIKRNHWLKQPKAVPQKTNLDQNINDSKSYILNYFIENIISDLELFYNNAHVSADINSFFFISHFLEESLKANKNH